MQVPKTMTAIMILFAATMLGGHAAYAIDTKAAAANKTADTKKVVAKKEVPKTVEVQSGDSLSGIAGANATTWVRIYNANESISDPNSINPGDKLRIPKDDEQLADRYSQYVASMPVAVAAAPTYTTQTYSSKPVNSSSYYVGNGMWCTDYVHSRRPDIAIYGNAGYNWINSARAAGKSTGDTAQAGAVAVTNGHVAYVEYVNTDGSYAVSEMGWNYTAGNYNERTVKPGTFGEFIY